MLDCCVFGTLGRMLGLMVVVGFLRAQRNPDSSLGSDYMRDIKLTARLRPGRLGPKHNRARDNRLYRAPWRVASRGLVAHPPAPTAMRSQAGGWVMS